MISRYMIKILSFDINNHISQMISTNSGLISPINLTKLYIYEAMLNK